MASAIETAPAAQSSLVGEASNHAPNRPSRGNRRGVQRGPRGDNASGLRGARRGGSSRGNRVAGENTNRSQRVLGPENHPALPIPHSPGEGSGGSFDARLTKDAGNREGETLTQDVNESAKEDEVEAEVCFICASAVEHNSVAPCNHRTCHICALRLRALYKTRACAHCRTESDFVIFTDDPVKRYEDFEEPNFEKIDETLGVKYEKNLIYSDTLLLLRYNCPDASCDVACYGWPDLHRHVRSVHHKIMCDLCTRNKKVFTHEHELFTQQEIRKHEKFGDDNPGAIDQSGFKGHPECGFCRQRFYGDDELYTHCRDKHERCHLCDRREERRQQQYYINYDSLEQHFKQNHFLCADQECLDKKFVVFESEMDLQAHQLQAHPNGLTKGRDARRVNISAFDYRTPHQDHRGGRPGREGRGRGRGRDPNTEALPLSTAQPLRRDEVAYQRQMAIQNAQSSAARTFGGQLTSTDTHPARPSGRDQDQATVTASRGSTNASFPPIDNLNISPDANIPSVQNLTPQEQARRLQHASVTDRASTLLKNDPAKLTAFRNAVSSYRTSAISASQLIDTFFSLFDVPSSDIGKLIKELADIYENESKRNDLLKAWNDWRAINEDYPSLPGPSGVLPGSSAAAAGSGGMRVLKLKSSTAQSSRSAVSRHGSWGNAAPAVSPFPAIPTGPASANRTGAGRVGQTPWTGPSAASSNRASPAPSRPASKAPISSTVPNANAFPALPTTAKPNTLMAGVTRGNVRWDQGTNSTSNLNPWGTGAAANTVKPASSNTDGVPADDSEIAGEAVGQLLKKKGTKAKKQTLYKFG
ncbi:MAG: hypothetical protein Q9191_004084 [Dirinaria sp. TL-2023a]